MANASKWLLPAATGIAGLAAGLLLGREPAVVASTPWAPAAEHASVSGGGLSAEDVRRVVREELAARAAVTAGGPNATLPPLPEPVSPETEAKQSAASAQAQSVLAGALSRRNWTEQDADGMREVFNSMSAEQQADFLTQFASAVNQGRLVPQTERIPF